MNALRLWLGLVQLRYGALHWGGAVLLVAAALLHGVVVPRIEAEAHREEIVARAALSPASSSGAATADDDRVVVLQQRYIAFATLVPDEDQVAPMVSAIFAHAARRGLVLAQADYRRSSEPGSGLALLELRLPVKGGYPQVRHFINDTLSGMPGVALREVSFRRDSVSLEGVEAQLRFVLFMKEPVR